MRITVIGTGYLGAVHAACMADLGHDVLGVDTDAEKVEQLAAGRAPFFEPGLDEVLSRATASGKLRFSTSLARAATFGRIHFICVGTPQRRDSQAADLSAIYDVVGGLAPHLTMPCLIAGKSTVPVGTAAGLARVIAELAPAGSAVEVAWNPEFLREGFAVHDTFSPDRVVVGAQSSTAHASLRAVYAPMIESGIPYISTDLATAELTKVSANAFLATKISFINAVADLCDATGADVLTLADALGYDQRIGRRFLSAGLGFGGGCLPKDLRALAARAEELGVGDSFAFLRDIDAINVKRRERAVSTARQLVGGSLSGRNVAVLGAAFKPDSDDVRDSPALAVANSVRLEGALVRVHDPVATDNARRHYPDLEYTLKLEKACEQADLVLHLTEWPQYQEIDPSDLRSVVRFPCVLDARNALPLQQWQAAGWSVRALGRFSAVSSVAAEKG